MSVLDRPVAPPQIHSAPLRRRYHVAQIVRTTLLYLILSLIALVFLGPFYLMIRGSLMSELEISSFTWHWWSTDPQWSNLSDLFNDITVPFLQSMQNSAIIATLITVGSLAIASMAGYALARVPSRWSKVVFILVIATLLVPGSVTFVPSYIIVNELGWVSTLQGIVVPGMFSGFSTFLFRQFYLNFPQELEDAGRVDGLGYFGLFWRILLPNSLPILVALGVISFIGSWNSFLWPLVIGQDQSSWTVQVVLSTFITAQTINIPELMMGVFISILPLLVLFLFLQRYIAEGISRAGIKG